MLEPAPLITINEAKCRIGRQALLLIPSLEIIAGQRLCIFGGNGSGKSLLANLLAGKRIESGSYVEYAAGFSAQRDIHWVSFEEQQRLWQMDNKLDMSEYSADAKDTGTSIDALVSGSRRIDQADEGFKLQLLTDLGLFEIRLQGIRFLSSGQVRRALLARALYAKHGSNPQVIILDDPFETLDQASKLAISQCVESTLAATATMIQLCRRRADILPSISHIAYMSDLRLVGAGLKQKILKQIDTAYETDKLAAREWALPKSVAATDQSPAETLIELNDIQASYGEQRVFSSFSWEMRRGDHVLIEGPNGCGKSTLLSLLDGDNHKAYGQDVRLFGKRRGSGETVWQVKSYFGIVSNELHNKYQKGWKVLNIVLSGFFDSVGLYEQATAMQLEQAKQWLECLDLLALQNRYYQELSFGQQRLVLLARAMLKWPRILILDEPCVGLDDVFRQKILSLLDAIALESTTQLIYVSHVAAETPACLNRRLKFVANSCGSYTIEQGLIEP
jgi:molybdate transport system ATP-binding protein